MTLISVIVPCFNQGIFLRENLDCIIAQSHQNWECIIINDGSTDMTEIIALEYVSKDKRFRYKYQYNAGLSAARNLGLKLAKGDFIQLLDADDLIEPNKLKIESGFYKQVLPQKKIIFYSSMRYFEDGFIKDLKILGRDNFIAHVELKAEDGLISQEEIIKYRNSFVISAPLYPAELFKLAGDFDEKLKALEDWDFHLRCIENGYLFHHHYTEETRTLIRLHDKSMMRNQSLLDENFALVNRKHHLIPTPTPAHTKKRSCLQTFVEGALKKFIKF